MRPVILLFLFGLGTLAADPVTPEALKAAEKVFRDVYGKDYDRISKGRNAAEKQAFGKKIWDTAKGTANDPAVGVVFGDKAFPLLMSDAAGYPLALEIKQARVEPTGKNRHTQLVAVLEVLDKWVKVQPPPDQTIIKTMIDAARAVATSANVNGRETDVSATLAKARDAVKLLTPADAAFYTKLLAADKAHYDAWRRHQSESRIAAGLLKSDANDPRANSMMARCLIRSGKLKDAVKYLKASQNELLVRLTDTLGGKSPDPIDFGERWRTAAEAFPADKPWMLGVARLMYERGAADHPKHLEAGRAKVLSRDLPSFTAVGSFLGLPPLMIELADESERGDALLAAFRKTGGSGARFTGDDAWIGLSCLRCEPGTNQGNWFVVENLSDPPHLHQCQFGGFAVKQIGGTFLRVEFIDNTVAVTSYTAGPTEGGIPIAATPPRDWLVVRRDFAADHLGVTKGRPASIKGLRIVSDGVVLIDGVYLGRTLLDIERSSPIE